MTHNVLFFEINIKYAIYKYFIPMCKLYVHALKL